jgi:hypothetical protein
MSTHPDALPQHIPGHDARHGSKDHSVVHPGEIAIGVIIGRASEYFDFFVYGIASVLVFPAVFFPFAPGLEATLYAFTIFASPTSRGRSARLHSWPSSKDSAARAS